LVQRVLGKPHGPVGLVLINDRLDLVDRKLEPKLGKLQVIRKPKTEQELYRDI
jgi:hypothetical protein